MGFESFQIKLKGGSRTADDAIQAIAGLENILPDKESAWMRGEHYFLFKDGRHAIEMEVMDAPPRISCRFTLCHPPSVDAAFFELARRIMEMLDMQVTIRDDVRPEHEVPFPRERFDDFTNAASEYIGARRREWHAAFGDRELGATTNEACEQIIFAHCVSTADKDG